MSESAVCGYAALRRLRDTWDGAPCPAWVASVTAGSALRYSEMSLSRLNHGQPGVQAHPEIVQGTAQFHHEITDALLPEADPVFDN